jgi:hypothetical protein
VGWYEVKFHADSIHLPSEEIHTMSERGKGLLISHANVENVENSFSPLSVAYGFSGV